MLYNLRFNKISDVLFSAKDVVNRQSDIFKKALIYTGTEQCFNKCYIVKQFYIVSFLLTPPVESLNGVYYDGKCIFFRRMFMM